MSEFIKSWVAQQVEGADPDSLRHNILKAIEAATEGSSLEESSLRDVLLNAVIPSDTEPTDG